MLAAPDRTPAALESLRQQAIEQDESQYAMCNTGELGPQFNDFSTESVCLAIAVPDADGLD